MRIPDITTLGGSTDADPVTLDWHDVGKNFSNPYSSLLGVPLVGVSEVGNTTFEIESSYWEVRCEPFYTDSEMIWDNEKSEGGTFNLSLWSSIDSSSPQLDFEYTSRISNYRAAAANCTSLSRLVRSDISCEAGVCAVRRVRYSDRKPPSVFDSPNYWSFWRILCRDLALVDRPDKSPVTSVLVEQWMQDPHLENMIQAFKGYVQLRKLPSETFSHRLQMVMNTFWDSTLGSNYLTVRSRDAKYYSENSESELKPTVWNAAPATGVRYDGERYVCNTVFAALTIAISCFLFIAAGSSVILGLITKVPDILGYVSTLARDNPHFRRPVPSHLDGLEATRELCNTRVMIGDVHRDAAVGHVAFASVDIHPGRVNKERVYY